MTLGVMSLDFIPHPLKKILLLDSKDSVRILQKTKNGMFRKVEIIILIMLALLL